MQLKTLWLIVFVATTAHAFMPLSPVIPQTRSPRTTLRPAMMADITAAGDLSQQIQTTLAPVLGGNSLPLPELSVPIVGLIYGFQTPGVIAGLLSLAFGIGKTPTWVAEDIGPKVGRTLGRGNFGTVQEAYVTASGAQKMKGREGQQVVIKRCVNGDQAEIEAYFCQRTKSLGRYFPEFLGGGERQGDTEKGRLLVWRYEGSKTLEEYVQASDFPLNLEDPLFRARAPSKEADVEKRSAAVLREVVRSALQAAKAMHSGGVVHRDVKPANMIISERDSGPTILLADLGAAVDLRNGYNFNPDEGLLDPRYAPPEQYVLPQTVPRAPPALSAVLGSPFIWAQYAPGKFDTYAVGMMLLQMGVPQLRKSESLQLVSRRIAECGGDVEEWRERFGQNLDFALLDRQNGAGWELVTKLVVDRSRRLSAARALGHRYLKSENVGGPVSPPPEQATSPLGSATLRR